MKTKIIILALFLSGCTIYTCEDIRNANNPEYIHDYVRGLYWDCEIARIDNFEFIIREPDGEIYMIECLDVYSPKVTSKHRILFQKTKGDKQDDTRKD